LQYNVQQESVASKEPKEDVTYIHAAKQSTLKKRVTSEGVHPQRSSTRFLNVCTSKDMKAGWRSKTTAIIDERWG
jgi:hypothetical protein